MSASSAELRAQEALKQRGDIPRHIAVIMDGNGRWAREQGMRRVQGHKAGVKSVREVTECCAELGVEVLTLYTFSTENWQRPATEVDALMHLLIRSLRKEAETLLENSIRLQAIGDRTLLPGACRDELEEVIEQTSRGERMTLTLALSYSGRWEIARAARSIAEDAAAGRLHAAEVDEDLVASRLSTRDWPDPDLLIRTGGDQRLSNFLLWQAAYAELYFSDVYWPSFRRRHVYEAIRSFQDRDRRFGRVSPGSSDEVDASTESSSGDSDAARVQAQ
ncbi:MAG: isoprenyl transferase [Rhodothermales bacterium]|nr:isoprenyl transferase [Rhodothermales bacterium]